MLVMENYVRLSFPDYQALMDHPDWVERTIAIGDSDILIPEEWVPTDNNLLIASVTGDYEKHIARIDHLLDLYIETNGRIHTAVSLVVESLKAVTDRQLTPEESNMLKVFEDIEMSSQAMDTWNKGESDEG